MLIDLASWEVALDAASTKNTIQFGGSRKKMSECKNVPFRARPNPIVFFVGAAVGWRSAGAKYISTRDNSEATNKTMCANAKRGTISAEKKTNSYKVA